VATMLSKAQQMLSSPYFQDLTEYDVTTMPTFTAGHSTIDTTTDANPDQDQNVNHVWQLVQNVLAGSTFASWNPPSPNDSALNSPIYIQVRYGNTSGWGGSNSFSGTSSNDSGIPANYKLSVNVIDLDIQTPTDLDGFTWTLSHELVERLFTGL